MKPTHCKQVLDYMRDFGSITPMEAVRDIGCMRLAARINDLRAQGYAIGRRFKSSINRYGNKVTYAEYYLEEDNNA